MWSLARETEGNNTSTNKLKSGLKNKLKSGLKNNKNLRLTLHGVLAVCQV